MTDDKFSEINKEDVFASIRREEGIDSKENSCVSEGDSQRDVQGQGRISQTAVCLF